MHACIHAYIHTYILMHARTRLVSSLSSHTSTSSQFKGRAPPTFPRNNTIYSEPEHSIFGSAHAKNAVEKTTRTKYSDSEGVDPEIVEFSTALDRQTDDVRYKAEPPECVEEVVEIKKTS
jgi:hypothetical protein